MPRYHFDIHTEDYVFEDVDGDELPDIESAERIARKSIAETIWEHLRQKVSTLHWLMHIRDGEGRTIRTLPFIEVLKSP